MKLIHENGYMAELRDDGVLFIEDPEGNEVLCAKSCGANYEEGLLSILGDIPSFLEGVRAIRESREDL